MRTVLCTLLFLSALPDAMVVPVLKDVLVDRYGVSRATAQAFLMVNLLGALLAVPIVGWIRARLGVAVTVALACVIDGGLLSVLSLPLGWEATLAVRVLEGIPDAIVFGVLFQALGQGSRHVAARVGLGSTVLLLGIGSGLALGGLAASASGERGAPVVFVLGACATILAGLIALIGLRGDRANLDEHSPEFQAHCRSLSGDRREHDGDAPPPTTPTRRPPCVVLAMAFVDRATGGVLTGTLSMFLASFFAYDVRTRGWIIGVPLLAMALGAWPAGALAERVGVFRLRQTSALLYALAIAVIPMVGDTQWALVAALVVCGIAGAALLPTSLALEQAIGGAATGFTAFGASGGAGFACGTIVPIAVLGVAGDQLEHYRGIILGFALLHLAVTCLAWAYPPCQGGRRVSCE